MAIVRPDQSSGGGGGGGVQSVAAGDTSIVVGGTATHPTVETASLDVIAADHATAGDVAMGAHKITGLGNGSAATDALAVGQVLAVGALPIADIADPGSGKVIGSSGGQAAAVQPPGTELDYVERTTSLTVTVTTDGNNSAQAFIDGNAVTFSGSLRVKIEAFVPVATVASANQAVLINLYDGTTDLGRLANLQTPNVSITGGSLNNMLYGARFLTPSAGSHTYHIRAWKTGGTCSLTAAAGGASTFVPAFYRITVA